MVLFGRFFKLLFWGGSNPLKIHRGYVQPNVAILVKRSFLAPSSLTPFSVCKVFVGPRVIGLYKSKGDTSYLDGCQDDNKANVIIHEVNYIM